MALGNASALAQFLKPGGAGSKSPVYRQLQPPVAQFNPGTITLGSSAPIDYSGITSYYADPTHSDFLHDPALLQAQAGDATAVQNAESQALKLRQQLLAALGDPGLARAVLGENDPTLGAVSDNPDTSTSILARLKRGYGDTVRTNEDERNKSNLWYSSERARGLQSDARDYATSQADAIAGAQSGLDSISQQLAAARGQAQSADQAAIDAAYQRWLAATIANPPGATPGQYNPGFGTVQPGDVIDAAGETAPANIGEFPHLNATAPNEVFSPVHQGAYTFFEPHSTGEGYRGVGSAQTTPKKPRPLTTYLTTHAAPR